jgi:superfamily II DNA/RNA helicase
MNAPPLIAAYQELLELEKRKIDSFGLQEPPDPRSLLTDEEIKQICLKNGVNFQQLLSSDLLVEYPGFGWRTMHFDLIYRIIYIRNLELQMPIPLEYRIEIQSEPVPDFGHHKFSQVLPELIPNKLISEIIFSALTKTKKYEGLSSHQLPIVKELLSQRATHTTAAIVAPTASGKTLAFFLPIIVRAIERSMKGNAGISSILIYPRKALERDHLQSFLEIIDHINQGKKYLITVGIDDGDTKRLRNIQDNEPYRGMRCVECSNYLLINKKGNTTTVKCSKCSKEYPYLFASKEEIWQKKPTILITNIQTMYRRLLTPSTLRMFAGIDYVVFDEAHVYTDYFGGHVFYIIKLLRHIARSNGSNPYFVFSSATIPNPLDFIAKLAGVEADEIFYVDYKKTLEKVPGIQRRLMLYLYLLPHPNLSVETLTETLILAVALWCHRHNLKAITFVDSVAEISTLADYIYTTILGKRQGREIIDHLYNTTKITPENSYNWFSLAPHDKTVNQDAFKQFVLKEYKESIDIHYGQLPLKERAEVEYNFSHGPLKLLLSTSTLELGIDLSNVAVIIQHKLPITPESVVQRIGRSGRSSECLRIALGIIALDSSPLSTLYMFDERLRGRLADPNLLPPVRVGQASASIKLQHTLSLLLYKRALEGKPTFITPEEYLRSKQAVINAVREIASELNEELLAFNTKVGLFDDDSTLRNQILELKSLLSTVTNTAKDADHANFTQVKEKWEKVLTNVERNADSIRQTLKQIDRLKIMLEKIKELDVQILSELDSLKDLLNKAYILCSRLLSSAGSSYRVGDDSIIQKWYKENSNNVEMVAKQIPESDEILSRLHTPLLNYFINIMKGNYKAFREKYGFGFDNLTNTLTSITETLGSYSENGLASFLRELPNEIKFLQSVNITELIMYESLKRIENELKVKPQGIDIIDVINLLSLNRIKFSLMLEPPSPELQLAGPELQLTGVEEA